MTNNVYSVLRYIRTRIPYNDKVGISIANLAELSGVSNGYIAQIENQNYKKTPSPEIISKLSIAFAELLNLPEQTIKDALLNAAGYSGRTDPRLYVPIVEKLADTNFDMFLIDILGYKGVTLTDANPNEQADNAYINWTKAENEDKDNIIESLKRNNNKLLLDKSDDPDVIISLDGVILSRDEYIIYSNAVKTIRLIRG